MLVDVTASDAELVELARAGDGAAFGQLFGRHDTRVVAVCRQRLRSASDVDDAVQESFARALANLHQLRDPASFGPWVRSIAVRACMDQHRAARRVVALDAEGQSEVEDLEPRPDEVAESTERQESIRESLRELGARDRHALWMRHVREAPVSVVASELGMTEGSTRVMLARARQRFRTAAAGITVLVPPTRRQWLRDVAHMPMPAMDAVAMAVALTIAAGVGSAAAASRSEQERPPVAAAHQQALVPQVPQAPVPQVPPVRARRPLPAVTPASPVPTSIRPASVRPARPAATPPAAVAPAAEAAAEDSSSGRGKDPVQRIQQSVEVDRSYPEEGETDEIADVTIIAGDEESGVRLFGANADEVDEAAADAAANVVPGD